MLLGLVSKGIPWDVALSLDMNTMFAWCIALSELETGKEFDFDRMQWPDR